ncbi:IclR family transcriptional regulator [Priestia filamentosa]|uniref:IclR family transcriptional regulator n=1 Tax=Priestia filamentosa TaxID=1402861 RepID=UPI0038574183
MNNNDHNKASSVQVISRAAKIMRTLREHPKGLSLSQIAKEVNLARSTVQRIINSLEEERFVEIASASGGYKLGPELAILAAGFNIDLREEIRPLIKQLSEKINETVDLSILSNGRVLFVDQIIATHPLQATSQPGASFPLHCTANGKAILAALSIKEIENLLPLNLESYTQNTLKRREDLLKELEIIKREGIAFSREEHLIGICAVGAVIKDPIGNLYSISIPLPSTRFYGKEEILAETLRETCDLINKRYNTE